MAFLGVNEMKVLLNKNGIITPFEESRLKNGAYELSLGAEVYLTDSKTGKVELLNPENNRGIDINPGQFALLLTKEKVNIPKDKIAFISIKAGEKLKGLVNVSGFHVDPGFNDHLLFSVYNAGPSTIVLNIGEPYFPIWFAELKTSLSSEEAYNENNNHFNKLSHIPSRYIEFLKRGELTSPKALHDKIKDVEVGINKELLKISEKQERNDWLSKITIGLLITLTIKFVWDWVAYDKGYNDGKKAKALQEQVNEAVNRTAIDSLVSLKVDSILRNREVRNDTARN